MSYFSLADNPPYDDTEVKADISALQTGKVDKADGMGLISDVEKTRLSTVTNYDDTEIKADITKCATKDVATTTKNGLMSATNKKKLNGLATVATTGSYNDLKDKPNTSDYTIFMQETQPTQDGLWIKGAKKDFKFTQCDLRVPNNPILLSTSEDLINSYYCSSISFDKLYIYLEVYLLVVVQQHQTLLNLILLQTQTKFLLIICNGACVCENQQKSFKLCGL